MKSTRLSGLVVLVLALIAIQSPLAAQDQPGKKLPFYSVTDLGTLGGTISSGQGINDKGLVSMNAFLSGNAAQHAALWLNGRKTDLGTLGGPNSFAAFFPPTNAAVITGFADTSATDPLGIDFCFFGTHLVCRGFVWQNGVMSALPTLGGNNAEASAINNLGLAGGVAENTTFDRTCPSPEYQAKPVVWDKGVPQELPTFGRDPDGYVNGVNDKGQAVGGSGGCFTSSPSQHALLWQNGAPIDLGNLGGKLFTDAYAVNDQGMVIGQSDLPGDTNYYLQPGAFSTVHAFLWNSGVMTDLSALPGDVQSSASAINNRGQVVGGGSRAILWQDGELIDLNTLVPGPPFSPLYLLFANQINDRSEIVGQGLTPSGELHGFLAVPCDANHADVQGCTNSSSKNAALESNEPVPVQDDELNASQSTVPRVWHPGGTPAWHRTGALPSHSFPGPAGLNTSPASPVPAH